MVYVTRFTTNIAQTTSLDQRVKFHFEPRTRCSETLNFICGVAMATF